MSDIDVRTHGGAANAHTVLLTRIIRLMANNVIKHDHFPRTDSTLQCQLKHATETVTMTLLSSKPLAHSSVIQAHDLRIILILEVNETFSWDLRQLVVLETMRLEIEIGFGTSHVDRSGFANIPI